MTNNNITSNNLAVISGQITGNFRPCPGKPRKNFCMAELAVKRLSGHIDYIPVTIDEKTASKMRIHTGQNICISGRFTSYNYHDADGSHLCLSLLACYHAFLEHPGNDENSVFLNGYISRTPVFRITPLGRWITELTIAVNYPSLESDYIPCICWNWNALTASMFSCGTNINAWGRIQSRKYLKKENTLKTYRKTAYEVSIRKIELLGHPAGYGRQQSQ